MSRARRMMTMMTMMTMMMMMSTMMTMTMTQRGHDDAGTKRGTSRRMEDECREMRRLIECSGAGTVDPRSSSPRRLPGHREHESMS
jgi:hypothetical protein